MRLLQQAVEHALAAANRRYFSDPRRLEPAGRVLRLSSEELDRSVAYATDRVRFGLASRWAGIVAGLAALVLGGVGLAEAWSAALTARLGLGPVATGLVFFALIGLASGAFELPFDLYETFVIEERHGFNRQTLRGFLLDRVKSLAVGALLGGALLGLLLWIMGRAGSLWWLWAWAAVTAFGLITAWIYPTLLAPLFNRFTPLPEGDLRERILALASRVGFRAGGIFVMDASRRSAHGNAYFTGLWGARRIVLFDTLLEGLATGEVVAVLAHELGHFKLSHVRWNLVRSALLSLAILYALSLAYPLAAFYTAFGLGGPSAYGALLVFGLWFGPVGFLLQPWLARISRRNEFAADAFAAATLGGAQDLGDALLALRERSHVVPISHPVFSAVYHSHPPLLERLHALGYA